LLNAPLHKFLDTIFLRPVTLSPCIGSKEQKSAILQMFCALTSAGVSPLVIGNEALMYVETFFMMEAKMKNL
jgi:hypothetical protein